MFLRFITLIFLIYSMLFADTLKLNKGWNLVGSATDLNVSTFSTANTIWKYKNSTWEVAYPNGSLNAAIANSNYTTFTQIYKNEGFWVSVNSGVDIALENNMSEQTINLQKGWNLVGSGTDVNVSTFSTANMIWKYKNGTWEVVSPNGIYNDGVASSGFATFNQISKNEGFWVYVNNDLTVTLNGGSTFDYRAWGISGDALNSKLTVMVNGVNYTLIVFSNLNIEQSNASTSPDKIIFTGTLNEKPITNSFAISHDYSGQEVVIKVFSDENNLTTQTLLTQSQPITANNASILYDMRVEHADDFRPIQPIDTNIEMPPAAPVF